MQSGTVVHLNPVAGSYTLAGPGGELTPIHAEHLPDARSKLTVSTQQLFNGTYAQTSKPTVKGTDAQAKITGYVSYRDPTELVYAVSVRGASMLVHVPSDGTGSAAPELPDLGTYAVVAVSIRDRDPTAKRQQRSDSTPPTTDAGCAGSGTNAPPPSPPAGPALWQRTAKFTGPPVSYVDMEGIVRATCTAPSQLTLSADDLGESQQDLVLAAPAPIDVSKVDPGQAIDVTAELGDDGSYSITGLSSDQGARGADDRTAAQGDQAG